MKNKNLIIILVFSLLAISAFGADGDGGYAGAFLKVPVEARPTGMGGAYIGVSNDAAGQLFNPAGIISIDKTVFSSSYRFMTLDRSLGFLSIVTPARLSSVIGFSWLYAGYGEVEERDGKIPTGSMISSSEHAFAISFAKLFLPALSIGTKLNYYHKNIAGINTFTLGFNLGATVFIDSLFRYASMEGRLFNDITAGVVFSNIAAKYSWDQEATGLNRAADDIFPRKLGFGISGKTLDRKLLLAADLEKNFEQSMIFRIGGEYLVHKTFLVRTGLNDGIFTAGLGFKFQLKRLSMAIDYAFSDDRVGEGEDHIFSLNINF
ncbi:MAG: PorV/PorQ family protein [Candidatus Zixiibacteriota bacterium]